MHLGDPVAQRIHNELQHLGVLCVERIAGAGIVEIVPFAAWNEAIVGRVVQPPQRERRAELVVLASVVIDDIEDDLDSCLVQRLDHRLEFAHLFTAASGAAVSSIGREETERVVPPVVRQAHLVEPLFVDARVDRQELDGSDAETGEVVEGRRMSQAGIRAAQRLGDRRVLLREPLDVGFVDDRVLPGNTQLRIAVPVELRVDHDPFRHAMGVVLLVKRQVERGVIVPISVDRRAPVDRAAQRARIWVYQQLVGVIAQTIDRFVRASGAESISLSGADAG